MARVSLRLIIYSVFGWCVTGLLVRLLFRRYATTSLSVSVTAVGEEQTAVYGKNAIHKVRAGQPSLTNPSVSTFGQSFWPYLSSVLVFVSMYTVKACVFSCKSRYSVYFRVIRELWAGCFICCRIEYDRNISTQHIATLLDATCCVRLATLLRRVVTCLVLLTPI